MREFPRGVLFSDLDGTFLDPEYTPAIDRVAWRALREEWRIVWVSSRTADELHWLQRQLGHREDAIGENGGVLLSFDRDHAAAFGTPESIGDAWVITLAASVATTRARVHAALVAAGATATDVATLSAHEFAARSGYSEADARRALTRRTSVLLTELSPAADAALQTLRAEGCTVVHGGRWTSVVDGADKGRSAIRWRDRFAAGLVTVGVGDADNDAALLAVVDHPFVINTPMTGPSNTLLALPRARALTARGTAGWTELVGLLPTLLPEDRP
jgi:mannosyl-3-phosphoglycerate phosphatase family protein